MKKQPPETLVEALGILWANMKQKRLVSSIVEIELDSGTAWELSLKVTAVGGLPVETEAIEDDD